MAELLTQVKNSWEAPKTEASAYTHPFDVEAYSVTPMMKLLGNISGQTILDSGCGSGILSRRLANLVGPNGVVIGIDTSEQMLQEAYRLQRDPNSGIIVYSHESADQLSIPSNSVDAAISHLVINNFSTGDTTRDSFEETARVLKEGGIYVISLPHPLTLDQKTAFRWTEWKPGQTQQSLVTSEGFTRKIMGKGEKMLEITNYYWPPDVLENFASRYGLAHVKTVEAIATENEIKEHGLEPIQGQVPFFLVMAFQKQ